MIAPVTSRSVCELTGLPHVAGQIPTAQVRLDDIQVAPFATWLDDQLHDLEWKFQKYWTHNSTLDAIFQGSQRR